MLKQNTIIQSQMPMRFLSGPTVAGERSQWGQTERRNVFYGEAGWEKTSGIPLGNLAPASLMLPQQAGALASRGFIVGSGTVAASALAVVAAVANLAGSGTISSAFGGLVVNLAAGISGSGTITDADVKAFLAAVADLSGSGGVTSGDLKALGALIAALTGEGTAQSSVVTGFGEMAAALVVTGTGLTTANVGSAVWAAIASANDLTGTMGEKLNDAGSASNPWTEIIESGFTAAQILRLIAAAVQGNATGLESGAPAFKGLDGTTTRIDATYAAGVRVVTDRDAD